MDWVVFWVGGLPAIRIQCNLLAVEGGVLREGRREVAGGDLGAWQPQPPHYPDHVDASDILGSIPVGLPLSQHGMLHIPGHTRRHNFVAATFAMMTASKDVGKVGGWADGWLSLAATAAAMRQQLLVALLLLLIAL